MKFIDKFYSEDKFRSNPCGKWCPYQLGYEEVPKEKDRCPEAVKSYSCHACWDREMPEPKPSNANDFPGFEINDVVQLRSGRLCIVLPNNRSKDNKSICYTYKSSTEGIIGSGVICLNYYSDYTGYIYERNCLDDVVKLWRATPKDALALIGHFFNNKKEIPDFIKPIWVEPTAKRMTIKKIEKELGYSIEII